MLARRLLKLLLMLALAIFCPGCAGRRPDHVSVFVEHDESETTGGQRPQRTSTNKVGINASYDLGQRIP